MSKAIYKPKGKAGEYAEWACNLYVGCSNNCSYCYCKRGVLGHAMGGPVATLKKCFKDWQDALRVFKKELDMNILELQRSSLFFTFSSDPMIGETAALHWMCIIEAVKHGVRCQVLTKNGDFPMDPKMGELFNEVGSKKALDMVAWGFTLTGCDELEPGASPTSRRIEAMAQLLRAGFRTFASLEPIVVPAKTATVAAAAAEHCDLFKLGLQSGVPKDYYQEEDIFEMCERIRLLEVPTYYKNSLTDYLRQERQQPIDIFSIRREE